jgi:curved DNA-binding protein CbpA
MTTPERADRAVNLYEILGVAPDADEHQLDQAFRVLARRHHPDTRTQQDEVDQPGPGSQRFQDVLAAYAVLRDPVARAAYDRRTRPATKLAGKGLSDHAARHTNSPRPPMTPLSPPPGAEPPLRVGPVHWQATTRRTLPATDRPGRPTAARRNSAAPAPEQPTREAP